MIFFKNHAENEAGRHRPFFKKKKKEAIYEVKVSDLQFNFNIFPLNLVYNKYNSPQLGIQ